LKEGEDVEEKQGEIVAEDTNVEVEQEQETAVSPETTMSSSKPIHTRPNPKESCLSLRNCRQTKRKAAAVAISSAVNGEDCEADIAEDCEEDCELAINDCSKSGIQGPKTKKARKGLHQEKLDKRWEAMFQLLLEYRAQHGNTLVPNKYVKNPKLGRWVDAQRYRYSKEELLSNRFLRLESIGFVWSLKKILPWESMFQLLKEYKTQHGNTLVPYRYKKNPKLGNWVHEQRYKYSKEELSNNRVWCLESIGFVWGEKKPVPWESMFQLLKEYKTQHGNTLVPCRYDKNPKLGRWVHIQRCRYSKEELPFNHVLRLESIGFLWYLWKSMPWESMFQLLKEYKTQHGNTLVPYGYDENPRLARWVKKQRWCYSKEELSSNRVLRLESIGFSWCVRESIPWESMFQLLKEYKTQHGNTLVPYRYEENPRLGRWVSQQRSLYSKGKMLNNRVLCLESIGFVFDGYKPDLIHSVQKTESIGWI